MNVFNLEHTRFLMASNILEKKDLFPLWVYPYI